RGEAVGRFDVPIEVEQRVEPVSALGPVALGGDAREDPRGEPGGRPDLLLERVEQPLEPRLLRPLLPEAREDPPEERVGELRVGERREQRLERLLLLEELAALRAGKEVLVPGEPGELLLRGPTGELGLERGAERGAIALHWTSSAR